MRVAEFLQTIKDHIKGIIWMYDKKNQQTARQSFLYSRLNDLFKEKSIVGKII